MRRIHGAVVVLMGLLIAVSTAPLQTPASPGILPLHQRLLGAWRLVAIEYRGAHGETRDPFYQPNSTGLIVYDRSGWMSVQISAPYRPALPIPDDRTTAQATEAPTAKSAAFDSYYAYFGRWDVEPVTSQVIHHVQRSLLPAENGNDYAQTVSFEQGQLVFTGRSDVADGQTVRRKIWEKLPL